MDKQTEALLNRLVAEYIMGWHLINADEKPWCDSNGDPVEHGPEWITVEGNHGAYDWNWTPATFIAHAWDVLERMTNPEYEDRRTFRMNRCTDWHDPIWGYDVYFGELYNSVYNRDWAVWARTAPLAICCCALHVRGVDLTNLHLEGVRIGAAP